MTIKDINYLFADFALENSFIDQTPMLFHINQKNKKSEKFNTVNGVTKVKKYIDQLPILYTGQRIGIGNRSKIFLKVQHPRFMILLQDVGNHILMEEVVQEKQHVQFEFSKI